MSRLSFSRVLALGLPLLATLGLFVACNGGNAHSSGAGPEKSQAEATLAASVGANSVAGQRVSDLIAGPDASFSVAFTKSQHLYFNAPERLVWRQGKGMRRWDVVVCESSEPCMGWFSVESDEPVAGGRGYTSMYCLWFGETSPGAGGTPDANVGCSEGGGGPGLIFSTMMMRLTTQLPGQVIAGRAASCYSFYAPTLSVGEFCVDSSDGIPLRLHTAGPAGYGLNQDLQAVSVSTAEQNLGFPVELQKDPVDGWWRFEEATVPISTLQLPDLSQLEP
jgi:hypothetical protein